MERLHEYIKNTQFSYKVNDPRKRGIKSKRLNY